MTCSPFVSRSTLCSLVLACALSAPAAYAYNAGDDLWNVDDGPIPYHPNDTGSEDITDGSDVDAVREAFRLWGCVQGTRIRFVEGPEEGPRVIDLSDGLNTIFWDEDDTSGAGFGPSTLGITVATSSPDGPTVRDAADIIFNGIHHTWSTDGSTDAPVLDVALHEAGHFLGLGHPCTDETETDCLSPSESIMAPAGTAGPTLKDDDKAGVVALYPSNDDSRCDGPYRIGEFCTCNDDCVDDLRCANALDGSQVCSPSCSGNDANCPTGFACVLGLRGAADEAPGSCVKLGDDGLKPAGSVCQRDGECAGMPCLSSTVVGRTICRKSCESNTDCPDGSACAEGICLQAGGDDGIICPVEEEPGCGCTQSGGPSPVPFWFALLVVASWRRRRAERGPAR